MLENIASADELFSALRHLKHNKHEIIIFHVVDKNKEIDFEFDNRPYKFIDLENGDELKITPNEVKELYVAKARDYKNRLKLKCGQYNIEFIEADINRGFEQILLPYLLKREKLY
jgi:DNA-dependent RNA polymerase auxiliary subunit epsilon